MSQSQHQGPTEMVVGSAEQQSRASAKNLLCSHFVLWESRCPFLHPIGHGMSLRTIIPQYRERKSVVLSTSSKCALSLIFFLFSSVLASAGDYAVAHAFDTGDGVETAKTETCEYAKECRIVLEKANLTVSLNFWHPDHEKVSVEVTDERPGCCYFSDGAIQGGFAPPSCF